MYVFHSFKTMTMYHNVENYNSYELRILFVMSKLLAVCLMAKLLMQLIPWECKVLTLMLKSLQKRYAG